MKYKLQIFVNKKWIPEPIEEVYDSIEEATSRGRWWVACNPGLVTAFGYIYLEEESCLPHT